MRETSFVRCSLSLSFFFRFLLLLDNFFGGFLGFRILRILMKCIEVLDRSTSRHASGFVRLIWYLVAFAELRLAKL